MSAHVDLHIATLVASVWTLLTCKWLLASECACDASDCHLSCTCTHTYYKQTVARQCVSSHDRHNLISTRSDTSMASSSTCARLPRVQFEEGREQTRAQRHLRGNTHKHKPTALHIFLHIQTYASSHTTARVPCPKPQPHGAHAHRR